MPLPTTERRLHSRHRARTKVYVCLPTGGGRLCRVRDLSAAGVFLETRNLGLSVGTPLELAFAIDLGAITKIHRRSAVVAHVSRGGTGLRMDGQVPRAHRPLPSAGPKAG